MIIHGHEPKALVEERAGRAQVFVVPVDLPLGGAPIDRREARRHLGLPGGPIVLLLGLLRPYKGLGLLADAWPDVVARCPEARLVLAGAAPVPLAELERLRRMLGVEVREGYLPEEAIDLWAAAPDALVLPYLHGTHSGVLHRGLAMGTPTLASPPWRRRCVGRAPVGSCRSTPVRGPRRSSTPWGGTRSPRPGRRRAGPPSKGRWRCTAACSLAGLGGTERPLRVGQVGLGAHPLTARTAGVGLPAVELGEAS